MDSFLCLASFFKQFDKSQSPHVIKMKFSALRYFRELNHSSSFSKTIYI